MIANENQYSVTQKRERQFACLVNRMEHGEAQSVPGESMAVRKIKLDAAKSVLQELRQELRDWETSHRAPASAKAAVASLANPP